MTGVPKLVAVITKFPEKELAIRRLCRQEPDFAGICEDYGEAYAALRHWEQAGPVYIERADEYRAILAEIEADIRNDLSKHLLHVSQQGE